MLRRQQREFNIRGQNIYHKPSKGSKANDVSDNSGFHATTKWGLSKFRGCWNPFLQVHETTLNQINYITTQVHQVVDDSKICL